MTDTAITGQAPELPHAAHRKPVLGQGFTVVAAGFLPILAIVSMFPAVPAIIDHFIKTDPQAMTKVPAMVSAPGLTISIIALFIGLLVDRFGRRRLMLVSTALYGVVGMAPFFLENLDAVYASRLMLGVAEAAILTTLNTLIGDYWDDKGRRNWLTLQGLVGPFLASGVILASGYLTAFQWNAAFLIYGLGFPIFLAAAAFLYEPDSDLTARRMLGIGESIDNFPWKSVIVFGAVTLVGSALYYVFIINGGMVWREIGYTDSATIGRLTTIPSLFVMLGAAIFWLTGRWGARAQLTCFFALLGGGLLLIGTAHDWRGMVLGMAVQQTGAGMAIPTLIAWAQTFLPFQHRGRGMGIWTACFFFGQFSSPLLVSVIRNAMGTMQGAFVAAGIGGLVFTVIVAVIVGRSAKASGQH